MKTNHLIIAIALFLIAGCTNREMTADKPPIAKVDPVEDAYFGTVVTDPYRYMENLEDSTVMEWIISQSEYSRRIINSIPGRQHLLDKMIEFDQRRTAQVSMLDITDNDYYFYLKETPGDETGKLYFRKGFEGEEIFLYDPLSYSEDTTRKYVINGLSASPDGSKIAFGVSEGGSENAITLIMDVETRTFYPEKIDRCFPDYSWLDDNSGFTYAPMHSNDVKDPDRMIDIEAMLHITGTDPSEDRVLLSRKKYPDLKMEKEEIPFVYFDHTSGYMFGFSMTVSRYLKIFYAPGEEVQKERINWKPLIGTGDEVYDISITDKDLYLLTPKNAPNFRILKTSLVNPDIENAAVVVPENKNAIIKSMSLTADGLYYTMSINGVQEKLFFLRHGTDRAIEPELPYTAGSIGLRTKNPQFSDVWITLSGWTSNSQRFRYLPETKEFRLENLSDRPEFPEYKDVIAEEVMVESHDGVMVPLSLIYKKEIQKDAKTPVLLFGYGAYGIPMDPFFSPEFLLWVAEGGVFAVAHVRGGGELGKEWHLDGQKTTKPNTWKDLIACAEYMINESYTSPGHLAIYSASAGGILVGRAMTERPDLFAAVIPEVGVMNTVRTELEPAGPINIPEFGTVEDSVEFFALLEMDSYHHLEEGVKYPATYITGGMNDPRVIAWQPAKFAARMQAVNASDKPVLLLIDFEAGHGVGDTKIKRFESLADALSFGLWQTGHPDFQMK